MTDIENVKAAMERPLGRRAFLRGGAAVAAGAVALPAFHGLGVLAEQGRAYAAPGEGGYGPLSPKADLRDGVNRLALPEGFQYRSFGVIGSTMSDGHKTPLALDGMAVFNAPNGRFRLVRNHEDRNGPNAGSIGGNPATKYDPKAGGGTTTLVVNPFTRELEEDFISLNGTIVNCAGGLTPWGSWITCEETNGGLSSGWDRQHGYCFEVPAAANAAVVATPILDMGRFAHEAIAVDPATGYVYETEDNGNNSGFYRFLPNVNGQLIAGGRLQMLAIVGQPGYATYAGHTAGASFDCAWVDIANPNPAGTSSTAVFNQGLALGGARFGRLEGCWYGDGAIYFASTSGGASGDGQIWEYRPTSIDAGKLTLIFESPSADVLDSPDNLAVSPRGGLLLCEDGSGDQYLRGVTMNGGIFDFALALDNASSFEWAGGCFAEAEAGWNAKAIRGSNAPLGAADDRITLFVNRQGPTSGAIPAESANTGMTFAIWGPWKKGAF